MFVKKAEGWDPPSRLFSSPGGGNVKYPSEFEKNCVAA